MMEFLLILDQHASVEFGRRSRFTKGDYGGEISKNADLTGANLLQGAF